MAELSMTGEYYGTYDGYASFYPYGAAWFIHCEEPDKSPVPLITEVDQVCLDLGIKLKTKKKEESKKK